MINGAFRAPVEPPEGGWRRGPFALVPAYPDLPMEEVYPRTPEDACPEVIYSSYGKGRVVYIASDVDRRFWEYLTPDHGRLLANSVLWAMNAARTVETDGKGFLDVTCWRDGGKLCLHVVNLTNPNAMRGAFREVIPIAGLSVRLRVAGEPAGPARALAAGRELEPKREGDWIRLDLPEVAVHEAVVLDLGDGATLQTGR